MDHRRLFRPTAKEPPTLVKAFIWFNQDKETDWRIESSASAQNAFANAMSSSQYASNSYASLNASPIPIPQQAAALQR